MVACVPVLQMVGPPQPPTVLSQDYPSYLNSEEKKHTKESYTKAFPPKQNFPNDQNMLENPVE
eukprot:3518710-Amphidinium_carterae.1